MNAPTLVIMAAGAGSRFGGQKQFADVDGAGHPILDFSLFDARRAGFERVCFILRKSAEEVFREAVGRRMERFFHVDYVSQEPDALPEGFPLPEGRSKPWGTAHAVACCHGVVTGPFAVINADDFYGAGAFRSIFGFLSQPRQRGEFAMVGYRLRNTLTDHGSVSRGVCGVHDGFLTEVTERTRIERRGSAACWLDESGEHPLSGDETVSMNFWGFSAGLPDTLWEMLPGFLEKALAENPLKAEFYLPAAVEALLRAGKCSVQILPCDEVWHGVTYREDLDSVRASIQAMKARGLYPERFWEP